MSAADITARAMAIVQAAEAEAQQLADEDRLREAKVVLADAARDLRDLKRDIADHQRAIRESATDRRQDISGRGQVVGMLAGSKARGAMAAGRASAKRNVARSKADALRPYDAAKSHIDRLLAGIDRAKAQITDALAGTRPSRVEPAAAAAATPRPTPAPAPVREPDPQLPPPGFYPDQEGMAKERWWDGSAWTTRIRN